MLAGFGQPVKQLRIICQTGYVKQMVLNRFAISAANSVSLPAENCEDETSSQLMWF